jgi:GNAT superfamily N-acetyltransferase
MAQELQCTPAVDARKRASINASRRLWGLDWSRRLPWRLDDVTVEWGSINEALPFVAERYAEIFGTDDGRFFAEPMSEAKRRFCAESDVFLFRADGETVGLVLAHPTDWSTYYVRSTALLAEYRARGILPRFLEHFYGPLREVGVERIESDCSPSNQPVIRLHTSEGFMVTGSGNSDRWGGLLHMTKYLRGEPEKVFIRQFCTAPVRTGLHPKKDRSRS